MVISRFPKEHTLDWKCIIPDDGKHEDNLSLPLRNLNYMVNFLVLEKISVKDRQLKCPGNSNAVCLSKTNL